MPQLTQTTKPNRLTILRDKIIHPVKRVPVLVRRRPLLSFIVALGLLLALIAAGNFLFKPPVQEVQKAETIKDVQVFSIGEGPRLTVQAQVEKEGVIKIVAQSPGIVQQISVLEGDQVKKSANLVQLSTSYDGGNAPGVQTAIAAKQYQLAKDTFDTQKDLIQKQRTEAEATRANTDELRKISDQSAADSQFLADLNSTILNTLLEDLKGLTDSNTNDVNRQAILQLRSQISQVQSGQTQTLAQLRNLRFQVDTTKQPTQLADLQKEITLKQLDIQEKTLQINKDVAGLQVSLAAISASMMHPVAPFAGRVEKVYVKKGEAVNPGTPLLLISGDSQTVTAVAKLPQDVAMKISPYSPSILKIGTTSVEIPPTYISQEATDGQFYSVTFAIPDGYTTGLADGQFVNLEMPIGGVQTTSAAPLIPIDSVFQSQEQSVVHVVEGGVVKSKTVQLGQVMGKFVEVSQGLSNGDQVIINRNVIEGDKVKVI